MAIHLKFGVELVGESTAKGYEKQIPLETVAFSAARGIQTIGGGQNRAPTEVSIGELNCSKGTDISSPALMHQAAVGKSLTSATITWTNTGGDNANQEYLVITLSHPIITSYSQSSGGDRPGESFSLNFDKIEYKYQGWDGDKKTDNDTKTYNLATKEAK